MKLSLAWVADFVDLSGVNPLELSELITERVAEVERIHTSGCNIPKVVVGEIKTIEKIPNADKIQLVAVNVGEEELKIVCGASNIFEGAKVPIALVGCELPGGFKIEKRKMKGVESNGMICSESELGLKEKSEGILILEANAEIGKPFSEICGGDTILEIDNHAITHRADLFSHLGFAREIALLLKREFKKPSSEIPKVEKKLDVEVLEKKLCARYMGLKISNVEVKDSPNEIRERLEACGVRSINNIVDATNYVMLELGNPMHAFDAKKLVGGWLIVRKAKNGEKLQTIDEENLELSENNLVIADAEKVVALAGVMGGKNSEVEDSTKEIILESANFDAVSIRKTSLEFALRSESSLRFEKRLDANLPPLAVARFLEILRKTNPELRVEASADVKNFENERRILNLSMEKLEKSLGKAVEKSEVERILTSLEFKLSESESGFEVEIPSFRGGRDVENEIDLIEEVIRMLGYTNLPSEFPRIQMQSPKRDFSLELKREIEDAMVGMGFHETSTLALVSEKLLKSANQKLEKASRITNPPSEDYRYLRNSLLASLLQAASTNIKNEKEFRLFEISTVFRESQDYNLFTSLIVGEENAYQKIRGVLEKLLSTLHIPSELSESIEIAQTAHPGRSIDIKVGGKKIGLVSELHPLVAKNFEIPRSAFFCINFDDLTQASREEVVAKDLPQFPSIPRDVAILVDKKVKAGNIENAISASSKKIQNIKLFDVYEGKGIPEGKKSLAFSFEIRDEEKTLEEGEGEEIFEKVVANIKEVGGELRS